MINEEDPASVKKFVSLLGANKRYAGFSRAFAKNHKKVLKRFQIDIPIRYEYPKSNSR